MSRFAGHTHSAASRDKTRAAMLRLNRSQDTHWLEAVRAAAALRRRPARACVDCGKHITKGSRLGRCRSCSRIGQRNPSYFDGSYEERMELRSSREYFVWRFAVRRRDKNTCQMCGTTEGRLEVDHIKPFALFPELRLEVSNGRVLCHPCHRATPTFGWKLNKHLNK